MTLMTARSGALNKRLYLEISGLLILTIFSGVAYNALNHGGIPLFYRKVELSPDQQIEADQVAQLIRGKRATVIDSRTPEEYAAGRLPDAINIPGYAPVDVIMNALENIPKDRMVITYCSGPSCPFAQRLAGFMRFQAYQKVYIFSGGVEAWLTGGYKLETE